MLTFLDESLHERLYQLNQLKVIMEKLTKLLLKLTANGASSCRWPRPSPPPAPLSNQKPSSSLCPPRLCGEGRGPGPSRKFHSLGVVLDPGFLAGRRCLEFVELVGF